LIFLILICLAYFQGYKAWLRLSSYWQNPNEWWGFNLAPWMVIIIFGLLLVTYGFIVQDGFISDVRAGRPTLTGMAVAAAGTEQGTPESTLTRLWNGFLNFL
jgi:hypothetical protein